MGGMHNFPLQSILKPLNSWSFFFFFFISFCSWMSDRQLCSFKWERERIFALDSFSGCLESVSWCFWKDWICNKIEHCDVGMVFHSTLESRRHLEVNKEKKNIHSWEKSFCSWKINVQTTDSNGHYMVTQVQQSQDYIWCNFIKCCALLLSHQMAANNKSSWGWGPMWRMLELNHYSDSFAQLHYTDHSTHSIIYLQTLVPNLKEAVPGPCCHCHAVVSHTQAAHSVIMTRQDTCRDARGWDIATNLPFLMDATFWGI